MNNKIPSLGQALVTRSAPGDKAQASQKSDSAKPKAAESSTVSLSATTIKLQELEQQLKDMPVADKSRVEAIRLALADNSYKIDAGRIAEGLLGAERNLPTSKD